ncbi:MAG: hypothetical protein QW648_02340 [Nanoarchaeales archaeon]
MIVELFLANAAVLILHIYFTYKNVLNPGNPIASIFLYSSIMLEININKSLRPETAVAYTSTISITSFVLFLNLLLLIFNMYLFVKRYIDVAKQKLPKTNKYRVRAY